MSTPVLTAKRGALDRLPEATWRAGLAAQVPALMTDRLAFMSPEHHRVRRNAVREIIRTGEPVPPEALSERSGLDQESTLEILDDLERRLLFLVRNSEGKVSSAFPVSADATPHRLTFSTGERLYGA